MAAKATPGRKGPSQPATYQAASYSSGATATMARPAPRLTHRQIAERAQAIWRSKGCPAGRDEQNWLEAEAQLKREQGIR